MATPLVPQEVFLLERYISLNYLVALRDDWSALIDHAGRYLDVFERTLPADYRNRPLPDQPDIVWGERILPNFRSTLAYLNDGVTLVKSGDLTGLGFYTGVDNDFTAFSRDYSSEWMDETQVVAQLGQGSAKFWDLLGHAVAKATNIGLTYNAQWTKNSLRAGYAKERGPMDAPVQWPSYAVNYAVRVATGQAVSRSGIYLPDADDSVAAFLLKDEPGPTANVGFDVNKQRKTGIAPTTWTWIERKSDGGGGIPGDADANRAGVRLRCEAGKPCPREGYWFTPALAGTRRHYANGEIMADARGDYGVTIWQWDETQ